MGISKATYLNTEESDKIRQMMIASANYAQALPGILTISEIVSPENASCRRKRRLDHLSTEEKILRKKLKNREAAQTSRDKKKAYVTSLEETIEQLREENKLLNKEIRSLKHENHELKKNLRSEKEVSQTVVSTEPGPAAPLFPLQQELPVLGAVLSVFLCLNLLPPVIFLLTLMTSIGLTRPRAHRMSTNLKNLLSLYYKKLMSGRNPKKRNGTEKSDRTVSNIRHRLLCPSDTTISPIQWTTGTVSW